MGSNILSELQTLKGLVLRLEPPLSEDHFILNDAFGRELPVSLRLISSWKALEYVVQLQFEGKSGAGRTAKRRYVLFEHVTKRRIDRDARWEHVLLPGKRIDMSILCWEPEQVSLTNDVTSCPKCCTPSAETTGTAIEW